MGRNCARQTSATVGEAEAGSSDTAEAEDMPLQPSQGVRTARTVLETGDVAIRLCREPRLTMMSLINPRRAGNEGEERSLSKPFPVMPHHQPERMESWPSSAADRARALGDGHSPAWETSDHRFPLPWTSDMELAQSAACHRM